MACAAGGASIECGSTAGHNKRTGWGRAVQGVKTVAGGRHQIKTAGRPPQRIKGTVHGAMTVARLDQRDWYRGGAVGLVPSRGQRHPYIHQQESLAVGRSRVGRAGLALCALRRRQVRHGGRHGALAGPGVGDPLLRTQARQHSVGVNRLLVCLPAAACRPALSMQPDSPRRTGLAARSGPCARQSGRLGRRGRR